MNLFRKILLFLPILFLLWLLAELLLIAAPPILAFLRDPKTLLGGQRNATRIYCLGDSFTYGMGMESNKAYPAILEQKLKEADPDKKVEVYNMGKPSHGLSYVYYKIKELHENKKGKDSLFLILGGWNVSDYDFARFDKEQSSDLLTRLKLFLNHFRTFRFLKSYYLFKKLYYPYGSDDYVPPFWAKTNYDFEKYQKINLQYLEKIAQYGKRHNLNIIFLNYPQNPPPANPYTDKEVNHFMFSQEKISNNDYIIENRKEEEIAINSIIRFIAQKYQFPLIDINGAYEAKNKENKTLFLDDGYHPSEEGQKIITEIVSEYLKTNQPW